VPDHLANLLDREQDRIALTWASALSRLRPSAYVYRPLEELRRLGRSYLTELIVYLDSDDPTELRGFIHREAVLRLNMGFGAAEVVQGFLAFRELAQDLCAEIVPDEADHNHLGLPATHIPQVSQIHLVDPIPVHTKVKHLNMVAE